MYASDKPTEHSGGTNAVAIATPAMEPTKLGLARECIFKDGMLRFEPVHGPKHHDHLVCERCGKIIEFEEPKIEKLQEEVARRHKFLVDWHRMELYGLCAECRKKEKL